MTVLAISGWGVLSAAGPGTDPLAALLAGPEPTPPTSSVEAPPKGTPAGLGTEGDQPPGLESIPVTGLDVRQRLGRKGTGFLDRATALALVACDQALEHGGVVVDDSCRDRVGVVLGTTQGSLRSTMDYSRETLVQDRPYLVNPALFPNTVMNCAAGQTAIRYGLKGINTTLAGGRLAFLQALRYAQNALRRGYADTLLVGATEELTDQTAWSMRLSHPDADTLAVGEGAALFVVSNAAVGTDPLPHAEVLSVVHGYAPDGAVETGLGGCVRRGLAAAQVDASEVDLLVTGEVGNERRETAAATTALGDEPARVLRVKDVLGELQAATGALQLAAVLGLQGGSEGDGRCAVITGCDADGGVAAAVVRRWRRDGATGG
ncbi:beta-ketoacyl synthase N-terminal-like domain-containing protein [Salinactinospora qingdaonensis]|uniref:Beta-ketoacyl synthase N-terminal-like domain-containing protein n=1 Tax=Salinactinospora qingdaonensis TaxID=702744 RepID=A0ABP7F998_9ACTN